MKNRRFYEAPAGPSARRSAPAALRNREPIAEVLGDWLPASGLVLEIASGTGEHAMFFAERFPNLEWQPSDVHPDALASIAAWSAAAGLPNVRPAIVVDAGEPDWSIERAATWHASRLLVLVSQSANPAGAEACRYSENRPKSSEALRPRS